MTRKADGTRSIKPAWVPLVLEDVVVGGVVTLVSKVAALRAKQLEATEYERNRLGSVARAAVKKRALERSLLARSSSSGTSSKVRASGHEEVDDGADSDSAAQGPTTTPAATRVSPARHGATGGSARQPHAGVLRRR